MLIADTKQARSRDLWQSLPPSLQYHIYKHLSLSDSDELISKSLGLSEKHFKDLLTMVALRDESPATVADIWDSCANSNPLCDDLMAADQTYLESDAFHQNLGAMVFAGNHEVAYESEILRAKQFLKSRNLPATILGIWIPDCSDSRGTEFFRNLPGEFAELAGIDITIRDNVVGEVVDKKRPAVISQNPLNKHHSLEGIPKNGLSELLNLQTSGSAVDGLSLKRGRHPLATVTSAEDNPRTQIPQSAILQHGQQDFDHSSTHSTSQAESQHDDDRRTSGVMRLRNRNSIPRTREATPYYLDTGSQYYYDLSIDDSETAAKPSITTLPLTPSSGFVTLKLKRKQELTKIFDDQPEVRIIGNLRPQTPPPDSHGEDGAYQTLVTLKISPEKLRLVDATKMLQSPTIFSTTTSVERLATDDHGLLQHSRFPEVTPSSVAQSPTRKRKADLTGISDVFVKRVRLAFDQSPRTSVDAPDIHDSITTESPRVVLQSTSVIGQVFAPSPVPAEMLAPGIETEENILAPILRNEVLVGSLGRTVSTRPAPIVPTPRYFERAPSFSPIPENEHVEEFQRLLRSSTAILDQESGLAMQGMIAMLPTCAVEGISEQDHTALGSSIGPGRENKSLPLRTYGGTNSA